MFAGLTVSQIHQENQKLTTDLYRQLKKYSALRALIKGLSVSYGGTAVIYGSDGMICGCSFEEVHYAEQAFE